MASFQDHFSQQAGEYAKHRLTYPPALFEFVASVAPAHDVAWDCATGNGQAAHGMRDHFERVIATDAAERQIEHAVPRDGIEYRVATAERSGLADRSVSAITVATAFHWLDHEAFATEVRRVAREGAVIAVWTYAWSEMADDAKSAIRELVAPQLAEYWPPAVRAAWEGYAALHFPFTEIETPAFEIRRLWSADEFIAYMSTWSATQAFIRDQGHSPFDGAVGDALREAWGPEPAEIRWPLDIRVGRVE